MVQEIKPIHKRSAVKSVFTLNNLLFIGESAGIISVYRRKSLLKSLLEEYLTQNPKI